MMVLHMVTSGVQPFSHMAWNNLIAMLIFPDLVRELMKMAYVNLSGLCLDVMTSFQNAFAAQTMRLPRVCTDIRRVKVFGKLLGQDRDRILFACAAAYLFTTVP
ncbi:hypothetical protein L2E82_20045 [Cichorium intybus]|uniref:Uncharacterized protein n=1 Tax=Cichorium intybus TaxID=13427 RepID=A0ACB9DT02_CICIN|nr:hypothetical protein L2E82_20045 [Cichorium intybus]